MKKQNLIFGFLVCMFSILVVYSCTKDQEQSNLEFEKDELVNSFEYQPSYHKDVLGEQDPVLKKEYCVGKITVVDTVTPGNEDKYKVGATICNLCDEDQEKCKDKYWTRIWNDGKFIALIKVDNDPEHCTDCPEGGIKIE